MEIISATALISINETFFVQLISFLVFLFILNRVMIRPLISTMEERKEHFAGVNIDIQKAKSDLDRINLELQTERAEVLKEADNMMAKLNEEADHNAAEIIETARSQITTLRIETEAMVKQQVDEARKQLSGEVDALTTTIMEKVLQRRLQS